jgi:phytoene dehydrogenase-like protein
MPDLIVIGSGLGGLCAAAIASRHGLEVQVLEAHSCSVSAGCSADKGV